MEKWSDTATAMTDGLDGQRNSEEPGNITHQVRQFICFGENS